MTDEEASAEALKRWGDSGYARRHVAAPGAIALMGYVVGYRDAYGPTEMGHGESFEEAFEMADVPREDCGFRILTAAIVSDEVVE